MSDAPSPQPAPATTATDADLLLREATHRCSNDLQLIVGLLHLQSRLVASEEARTILADTAERIAVLARARSSLHDHASLAYALEGVRDALRVHADPRQIRVSLHMADKADGIPPEQVTYLSLIVNELATNALKHAFKGGAGGKIDIIAGRNGNGELVITVVDDGEPMQDPGPLGHSGLGLGLSRRLLASMGGVLVPPTGSAKCFELRVPRAGRRSSPAHV